MMLLIPRKEFGKIVCYNERLIWIMIKTLSAFLILKISISS